MSYQNRDVTSVEQRIEVILCKKAVLNVDIKYSVNIEACVVLASGSAHRSYSMSCNIEEFLRVTT